MIKITGRYKELIIGEGGENIAPVPIEERSKQTDGGTMTWRYWQRESGIMDMWCSWCIDWCLANFWPYARSNYLRIDGLPVLFVVICLCSCEGLWLIGIQSIPEQFWQNFWTTSWFSCSRCFECVVDTGIQVCGASPLSKVMDVKVLRSFKTSPPL